jgi:hypothetical protein
MIPAKPLIPIVDVKSDGNLSDDIDVAGRTNRRRDGHRNLGNDTNPASVPTRCVPATAAFYQNADVSSRQLAYSNLKTIEDLRTVNVKGTVAREMDLHSLRIRVKA